MAGELGEVQHTPGMLLEVIEEAWINFEFYDQVKWLIMTRPALELLEGPRQTD